MLNLVTFLILRKLPFITFLLYFSRLSYWPPRLPDIWGRSATLERKDRCWFRFHHYSIILQSRDISEIRTRLSSHRHHMSHYSWNIAHSGTQQYCLSSGSWWNQIQPWFLVWNFECSLWLVTQGHVAGFPQSGKVRKKFLVMDSHGKVI